MAEDPKTRSLFLCVMDGHGEDGDKVSQNIKGKLTNYLFNHRDFATDVKAAIQDVLARCETEILRESSIETDFSGTTFTCAVIRDNKCIMANVGDSRTSIAYRNASGGAVGVNLTEDHKPDLPLEKVCPDRSRLVDIVRFLIFRPYLFFVIITARRASRRKVDVYLL